jgi:hypothetical protein
MPYTETEEPIRRKLLRDRPLPKLIKSKMENLPPYRMLPRRAMDEPIRKNDRSDRADPI